MNTESGVRPMCQRGFLAACLFLLMGVRADARIFKPWSYAELNEQADVVVIGTVKSTAAWNEPFDKRLLGSPEMVGQLTTFRLKAVLKGKLRGGELKLVHYRVSEKETVIINGPMLPKFREGKIRIEIGSEDGADKESESQNTPHYLLFLKSRADGKFEPVSGQVDSAFSVMLLKPEETPHDK